MTTFTWQVLETSSQNRTMLVQYESEGHSTVKLNLPLPASDGDLDQMILAFAPKSIWFSEQFPDLPDFMMVQSGRQGTAEIDLASKPAQLTDMKSWTEEELTALIKKVIAG